jgi:ParB family chromosome partitioning protein
MGKPALKPNLPSVDELFTTQKERDDAKLEKIHDIALSDIDSFPNHPYQIRVDEQMQKLVESIGKYGVQTPAIVRPKADGRYELVSGHRRKVASELAGNVTMPSIVREMDKDAATVLMVDTNVQREVVLPSEKAHAYRMKLEAMKRQGERVDLTCATKLHKSSGKKSREAVAESVGESHETIRRYIRLTELVPELLEMVDENKVALRPAVELSYLSKEEQRSLLDVMDLEQCTPSHAQALKLKGFSQEERLSSDVTLSIMREQKGNQVEQFKMPRDKLSRYFSSDVTPAKMEEIILKALEMYRKKERSKADAR